jgi:hypothetical protein
MKTKLMCSRILTKLMENGVDNVRGEIPGNIYRLCLELQQRSFPVENTSLSMMP